MRIPKDLARSLEKHVLPPDQWRGAPQDALRAVRNGMVHSVIARHPAYGWAVLSVSPGLRIVWMERWPNEGGPGHGSV